MHIRQLNILPRFFSFFFYFLESVSVDVEVDGVVEEDEEEAGLAEETPKFKQDLLWYLEK